MSNLPGPIKTSNSASAAKGDTDLSFGSRPELLTTMVYNAVRKAILTHQIAPGERVTEASLAERLQVSKTPVREALLELRRVGLVVDWGKRGGRVVEPSRDAFREISEVREAIEVFIAASAAAHATKEQKQAIAALAELTRVVALSGDVDHFHAVNTDFHKAIADAAGNGRLTALLMDALDLSSLLRMRDLPPLNNLVRLSDEHLEITRHIDAGDTQGAAAAAQRHVTRSRAENLEVFDRVTGTTSHK